MADAQALRPFRFLMAAVLVVPLALFVTIAAFSWFSILDEKIDQIVRLNDVVHEHARSVFDSQALVMDEAEDSVNGLSDEAIRTHEGEINRRLARLRQRLEQIEDIRIVDANGQLLAAARPQSLAERDLASREFFTALRDPRAPAGETHVSVVSASRTRPQQDFFTISRRRQKNDPSQTAFSGVIAISLSPAYFTNYYEDVSKTVMSAIALYRADGMSLARFPRLAAGATQVLTIGGFLRAVAQNPEKGVYESDDSSDGRMRYVAYQKLGTLPLYVGVAVERANILAQWARTIGAHLVFGVPAVLLLFFLSRNVLGRMEAEQRVHHRLVTEIARREEMEAQLRQSQKMDAVGRLTGGVAHDFNNLLTIISGSLDLIDRRRSPTDERLVRLIANAREGVTRAAELTRQLLAFARRQPLDPRPTDINKLVMDLSSLLRRTLGESIMIESVLGAGTWPTMIDPPQLENAIVNLAVNARDAMPDGGRLTIETANAHVDETYAKTNGEIAPGQYVTLSVTDTGSGVPDDIRDQIFEPFFTTKAAGQGTGLGLSQVFGFVKQSGGNVTIYSEVDRGTTVRLYLPRFRGAMPIVEPAKEIADPEIAQGLTILVAEDDADVRQLTTEALAEFGYTVVAAENGADALARLEHEPKVDLLLTDVVMPVMDGRKLAEAAQKMRPHLPVVFMTGYTPNAIVHNGVLDAGVHLLTKPFTVRQLSDKLQSVLAAPRAG